jgi:hypothetical protein
MCFYVEEIHRPNNAIKSLVVSFEGFVVTVLVLVLVYFLWYRELNSGP